MCATASDHPSATYRGYRRQALYALYRLFACSLTADQTVQPEGQEDLAVFDQSGALVDVVQVKDHSRPLTFSSFKQSFYDRIGELVTSTDTVPITIVSFGKLGRDFTDIRDGDEQARQRFIEYLAKHGLRTEVAAKIVTRTQFQLVSEDELRTSVLSVLRQTVTSVDAENAFQFLMYWLVTSSESQHLISRKTAIEKIQGIGRFLSQRAAFHDEWYASVIPLERPDPKQTDRDALTREFYQGVRARYEHIVAGLDVPRELLLAEIHKSFAENRVVVLRGASGQGKTALAYRYCEDFYLSEF